MQLLAIIPTYNEVENIENLIKAVFGSVPQNSSILVVDDNSPDGTAGVIEKISLDYPGRLHILKRPGKQGLATAYLAGFAWGWNGPWDVFLEIDADFSHNPQYIPAMLEQIQTYDVVIGSRNIPGGSVEGWTSLRNVISKGGSLYSRLVLGCPIHDLTGGFNMWRKGTLEKINLSTIISQGYSFQIEMKYKAYRAGCSIMEIPILFTDRKKGKSKMSKRIFFEALINIWKIRQSIRTDTAFTQFIKFGITGGLGTITNLAIFFLCADLLNLPEIPVSIGCFLIAGTQNYIINHKWAFSASMGKTELSVKKWASFLGASLAGLAVNITIMKFMLAYFNLTYKFIAQACGIAVGMLINFVFSKIFIFRSKKNDQ